MRPRSLASGVGGPGAPSPGDKVGDGDDRSRRAALPALGAGLSLIAAEIAVLGVVLRAATALDLGRDETSAWVISLYGVPALLSFLLIARHRQPMVLTGNLFVLIFIVRLGDEVPWDELVGSAVVAGALVFTLARLGVERRIALVLPAPIVWGLLAGAVLPFVVDMFSALGEEELLVGTTVLVYLAARRWVEPRLPATLVAVVWGLGVAALAGRIEGGITLALPTPVLTAPRFSLSAIIAVVPVLVVLITVQSNIPSVVFLREQGYRPPIGALDAASGLGTAVASTLGPTGISLSLPATALTSGPQAGPAEYRYLAALVGGFGALTIALLSGFAAEVAQFLPAALLTTIVALALLDILHNALQTISTGRFVLGPLFSFVIALSDLTLFGLNEFFWAIAGGIGVSLLLERDAWKEHAEEHRS